MNQNQMYQIQSGYKYNGKNAGAKVKIENEAVVKALIAKGIVKPA